MSDSLISQELIETIFVSLQEEDRNIRKIIKGLFNFLKENEYSNNEIRIALQEFFTIRREYIISEYNLTYNQVGFIVENLIMGIDLPTNPHSANVSVTADSSTSNSNVSISESNSQGTLTNTNETEDEESSEDEHLPRTRYVRFRNGYSSYDQLFSDPFIGLQSIPSSHNRFASLFNQSNYYVNSNGLFSTLNTNYQPSTINISTGLQQGNLQQPNTNLPSTVNLGTMTTHQLIGSLSNILIAAANNPNLVNMPDEEDIEDDEPFVGTSNGPTNNIALNLFNIILNSPAIRAPHMEDVKNVINEEELEKLEVKDWPSLDKEKYKTCPICLDDYSEESKVRLLKCEHGFHPECIDKWLTDCNYKCPVCRDDSNKHHAEI